ncbi:N-formylglutamate amidohydrolase [Phreatobacter cathodiphilus]|uniref:N-formylglutamate amidohydrolase n=1 Tax=Phreatobacter cathodiphilus TaxID=1868589 RepID=A0A2S0NFZ2_9HYPH|nr:N-formylglutamate amidohydrolase [Phreatobacter cathodiphilus]AVO47090.1 N-formylglutamate amidohydrolase [Phreatobacter cathodiphilus]
MQGVFSDDRPRPAAADEPAVVEVLRADGQSPHVLVCEHASNFIPARHAGLGLSPADLSRHIAYDIGAAGITRRLSAMLDAPAFLSGRSRLLIDGNRPPGSSTSIPAISETTIVPGNVDVSGGERAARERDYFWPFHDALARQLDERLLTGRRTSIVAIHSFTPVFHGTRRGYEAGILSRGDSDPWAAQLVESLRADGRTVLANMPYQIEDDGDYLVPHQAEPRGLRAVIVEVRQDLVAQPEGQESWARLLARALGACRPG